MVALLGKVEDRDRVVVGLSERGGELPKVKMSHSVGAVDRKAEDKIRAEH